MQQVQMTRKEKESQETESKPNSKAPIAKFSAGGIQVAVWENEGKEGSSYSTVTMDKRYKSGEEWKSTKSLRANDLPKAILVLEKAYEFMVLKDLDS
ncbi:MAG TPA: hypothetical protein VJH23_03740 [archaeon]|nr:hypothetical protein [archaeon]